MVSVYNHNKTDVPWYLLPPLRLLFYWSWFAFYASWHWKGQFLLFVWPSKAASHNSPLQKPKWTQPQLELQSASGITRSRDIAWGISHSFTSKRSKHGEAARQVSRQTLGWTTGLLFCANISLKLYSKKQGPETITSYPHTGRER